MIQVSDAFREAIVGSPRWIELMAVVDISDPDKVWLPVTSSGEAPWSRPEQLHNYELSPPPRYATGERNHWPLDGSVDLFPADYQLPGDVEIGDCGDALSGPDGFFSTPYPWVQLNFERVYVLQAFSLYFSSDPLDGVPGDFAVEVFQGNTAYFSQEVVHNTDTEISFRGFTVYNPTAIRVTLKRWTLPSRRVRLVEIVQGLFERWRLDMFESFSATLQGQFSCLTLPYGSVSMKIDNHDRRFEPRRKDGIFQSITERQGVDLYIGCRTSQGMEWVKIGLFYQAGDGWKTSTNSPTIDWYLVDIIGLICNRTFIVPDVLPTTLEGWLKACVSQLGDSFQNRFRVDPAYANLPVVANSREDVTGKKIGDIIRWACQATGTWPRARQQDGALTAEPLWNQGNKLDLDNLNDYPTIKANKSLAALIFHLADGHETQLVISGNSTSSEETVTIINPFLHTAAQARAAARLILAQYGGNIIETVGRGDPSSEIGDVDTIWLDESNATTARRMSQTFQIQDGVLQGCRSTLLQADGSYLWTEYVIITESGTWQAPPGVGQLRVVIVQGGQGGGYGKDGFVRRGELGEGNTVVSGYGDPGQDGQGGLVWYGVIDINPEQEFAVHIGAGGQPAAQPGQPGGLGEHTTFGPYSSANGSYYDIGYTDIANGLSFARTGVPAPLPGTGDGGKGGEGGEPGVAELYQNEGDIGYRYRVIKRPGPGHPGVAGASGVVMVSWEKPS